MRLFLLKDIVGLGMAGEIVDVAEGYARNRLLPLKVCTEVTKANASFFEKRKVTLTQRQEVIATETSMLAERIKDIQVTIAHKADDKGKLYGSVGKNEIAAAFKEKGIVISKNQVILSKPIKTTGSFEVTIKLSSRLQPSAHIQIVAEKTGK